jgi:hypothetical protein
MKNLNRIFQLICNWFNQAKIFSKPTIKPSKVQVLIEKRPQVDFSEMRKK